MWHTIPVELKGIIIGFLVGALLTLGGIDHANAAEVATESAYTTESSVFDLYDRAVMTIVAASECGAADGAEYHSFANGFARVYDAVEDELLAMNPGKTRDDLKVVIGFRTRFLEHKAETVVSQAGCASAEVEKLAQLFDIHRHLSMVGGTTLVH